MLDVIEKLLTLQDRDQRLRSFDDVSLLLKQPVLGVLPARTRAGQLGRSRAKLTKVRLLAALPRPAQPAQG